MPRRTFAVRGASRTVIAVIGIRRAFPVGARLARTRGNARVFHAFFRSSALFVAGTLHTGVGFVSFVQTKARFTGISVAHADTGVAFAFFTAFAIFVGITFSAFGTDFLGSRADRAFITHQSQFYDAGGLKRRVT